MHRNLQFCMQFQRQLWTEVYPQSPQKPMDFQFGTLALESRDCILSFLNIASYHLVQVYQLSTVIYYCVTSHPNTS